MPSLVSLDVIIGLVVCLALDVWRQGQLAELFEFGYYVFRTIK